MILICQNLRNNLQHPNEYIRGITLRFLCRIHEEELLEPLVPSGTPAPARACAARLPLAAGARSRAPRSSRRARRLPGRRSTRLP